MMNVDLIHELIQRYDYIKENNLDDQSLVEALDETKERLVRFRKHGLSRKSYIELVGKLILEQYNRFALCSGLFGSTNGLGDTLRTQLDHCHYDGTVRGVLCQDCNSSYSLKRYEHKEVVYARRVKVYIMGCVGVYFSEERFAVDSLLEYLRKYGCC